MKKLILILLAIMPLYCYAETPRVQNVEGELRAGLNFPTFGASSFFSLAIELRHNIKNTPWDCGITAEIDIMGSDNVDFCCSSNDLEFIAAVCNYNFKQGTPFNPYVGAALGPAYLSDHDKWSVVFAPRAGIEIASHFRIALQYSITQKQYQNFTLTIGVVFGGRPKKPKTAEF